MTRLIRFEDAYGMSDIICLAHDLPLINLKSNICTTSLSGINNINYCKEKNVYYECGISFPTLLIPNNELLANIKHYKIDEIIMVYDMDSPRESDPILSSELLEKYLEKLREWLDRYGLIDVKIKLLPAVWAAETFALYILACDYSTTNTKQEVEEPTKLIHTKNIAKFHSKIIEKLLEYHYEENVRVKHLRDYIKSKEKVIEGLESASKQFKDSINNNTIKWIIDDNEKYLFDINEAILHQEKVNKYYKDNQPKDNEKIEVCKTSLNMTRKCW